MVAYDRAALALGRLSVVVRGPNEWPCSGLSLRTSVVVRGALVR